MAYESLLKALSLLPQCEYYFCTGGQMQSVIEKAENILDITFSKQTKYYISNVGYISFGGNEVYGISSDNFNDLSVLAGNMVETALADRKDYNLPKEWLPIYFFDDGYMGYIDYSQLNKDGEPPVIIAIYDGKKYVVIEKIAEDLGDFLLMLVNECLES